MSSAKTLAICGDSWFTSDLGNPGKSFGEVLSSKYGYELLSLARGGCSNFAISLQVRKAIDLGADIVIVGPTTPDRIEIPIIAKNLSAWEKLKQAFNVQEWFTNQPSCYDPKRGLDNIKYFSDLDLSGQHSFLNNPSVLSESLNNLAFQTIHNKEYSELLTAEQVESLKYYMLNLYDIEIKRQYDIWAISDACRKLMQTGTPFLLFTDHLYVNRAEEVDWIPENNKVQDFKFNQYPDGNTRFHYSLAASKSIANYFQSRIERLL